MFFEYSFLSVVHLDEHTERDGFVFLHEHAVTKTLIALNCFVCETDSMSMSSQLFGFSRPVQFFIKNGNE